jgi:hypothetical protein
VPRFRFSLRAFLLLLFIASLIASNLFTSWQLSRLREESVQMRKELGRLVVSDPSKIHIVALPSYEDMLWRWRIYVPQGQSLRLFETAQDIPQSGFPTNYVGSSGPLQEGEYLLTAAIRRDRNGKWQATLAGPHSSNSFGIADEHAAWLTDSPGWETSQAGSTSTEVYNADQPFALLRVRSMKKVSPNSSQSTPDPMDGLLLWIKKQ